MDLLRTLTNHDFDVLASSLAQRLRSLPSGRASHRPGVVQRRARHGSIESAVLHTLVLADGPLLIRQVELEIERQLGGAVAHSSVKAALSKLTAQGLVFRRRRGMYGARIDTKRRKIG
jgi:hypothetical protein